MTASIRKTIAAKQVKRPKVEVSRILKAALTYAAKGWRLFPIYEMRDGTCACGDANCTDQGKHPRISSNGVDATTDAEKIKSWWTKWPDANIGFWLEGSGLAVLDIDVANGKEGDKTLRALLGGQPIPTTLVCNTPSGGKHLYYAGREGLPNKSNALGPGLDIWFKKHYLILPPSNHKAGGNYEWDKPTHPVADWPDILVPQQRGPGRPLGSGKGPKRERAFDFDRSNPDHVARLAHDLTYIDASDRDRWVQFIYAIARAFKHGEVGFKIADEWARSTTANNYNAKLTHKLYFEDSTNPPPTGTKPITVASIFEEAKKHPNFEAWEKHDPRLKFVNEPDNKRRALDTLTALVVQAGLPIYARGPVLIDIVQFNGLTEVERKRLESRQIEVPAGTPILRTLSVNRFEDIASKEIVWRELRSGKLRSGPYGGTTVAAFLERGEWPGIPVFRAFVQHPVIRSLEDRTIIRDPGLDRKSGLYLTDTLSVDVPKGKVSKKDALGAIEVILGPFTKYRFVDQQRGQAIVIAAILTSILRHCFRTVPGIAIEAAAPRSGKTKAAQAIGIVALGRRVPMTTYAADDDEMEKRMGALKMMGVRDVLLDNVKARMDSPIIESMITEERSHHRILGRSEEIELVNDGMIYVTGNGMTMSADMRRRFLTLIIDSGRQIEAAKRGDFDFDPPDLAHQMRPRIIAAALAVTKGFEDAKVSASARPVPSFEDWSYVRDVLLWLGYPDLGEALEENLADDEDGAGYDKDIVLQWFARNVPASGLAAKEIIERLAGSKGLNVNDILLRHKSNKARSLTGDVLTPELLRSALQKLALLESSWPVTIDDCSERMIVRKRGSLYCVERS
jgi:hypothetical protein